MATAQISQDSGKRSPMQPSKCRSASGSTPSIPVVWPVSISPRVRVEDDSSVGIQEAILRYGGHNAGCVRLASLGRPRSAHLGGPLTRANRACTSGHPQVTQSTSRALGADPGEPRQSYSNVPGQTGVDPGKLN